MNYRVSAGRMVDGDYSFLYQQVAQALPRNAFATVAKIVTPFAKSGSFSPRCGPSFEGHFPLLCTFIFGVSFSEEAHAVDVAASSAARDHIILSRPEYPLANHACAQTIRSYSDQRGQPLVRLVHNQSCFIDGQIGLKPRANPPQLI